jgi:hypothetical protein
MATSERWPLRADLAPPAPFSDDERDPFVRDLGFMSREALFEASLFVASKGGRKWYVTVDDRGKWWAWNDRDSSEYARTSSLDDAVRWVRRRIEFPSRADIEAS